MGAEQTIFILTSISAMVFGLFLFFSPLKAFDLQRRFYTLINWRIEPISVEKEIRNTRWMGIFTVVFAAAVCIYKAAHP